MKVIIYDCDGVLFDSKEANKAFYNHILKRFGMPLLSREQLEYVHVSTSLGAIDHLFKSSPLRDEAKAFLQGVDNAPFIPLLRLEPNVREVLEYLHPNFYTAIATNRGVSMSCIIEEHHLDGLFDMIVTTLDVKNPKPDPECLLRILNHFEAGPNEAVYIGDSEVDSQVAGAANVPFISYKNPDLRASYYFNDHMDLVKILLPRTEGLSK